VCHRASGILMRAEILEAQCISVFKISYALGR